MQQVSSPGDLAEMVERFHRAAQGIVAGACFDPRAIHPDAGFFVTATVEKSGTAYTPQTPVESLNLDFEDSR